jgi:hypothetical protein
MGIVVQLSETKVKFNEPEERNIGFDLSSNFTYQMHSFEIEYGVKFDKDPNNGLGGNPNIEQSWRLGIVQNVLFQKFLLVYEDQKHRRPLQVFEKQFPLPEVDTVPGSTNFPFYGDQRVEPGKALITRPGTEITYSSNGYRETTSKGSTFDNIPSRFNMWDQPAGATPLMKDDETFTLRRLERIVIFQSWLVAIKTGEFHAQSPSLDKVRELVIPKVVREFGTSVVPIASIPAFATTFFAEMDLAHFPHKHSGDTPNFRWGLSGSAGFFPTKKIDHSISKAGPLPTAIPVLGSGGRVPVTLGSAGASKPDEVWLNSLGLKL